MKRNGLALLEILLVMAIFAIIAGFGLVFSMNFYRSYLISYERNVVIGTLSKARSRAMANMYQSSHGVHFGDDAYTVFRGSTYDPSSPFNESFPKTENISISGLTDVVFEQLTGNASPEGSLTISNLTSLISISINHEGTLIW